MGQGPSQFTDEELQDYEVSLFDRHFSSQIIELYVTEVIECFVSYLE